MIMTPEKAVVASIIICLAGAVLTLLVSRSKTIAGWLAFLFTATTSGLIFYAVAHVLRFGASATWRRILGHAEVRVRAPCLC